MAKSVLTPVQTALARATPAGLNAAVAKCKAAQAAYKSARAALSEFHEELRSKGVASAESALSNAVAKREVAKRIGDDVADIDAEVDHCRREHAEVSARLAGREAMISGFQTEIENRRQALSDAIDLLQATYQEWSSEVLRAADEQLAVAARLAGEAQQTASALRPQYEGVGPVSFPRVSTVGWAHEGPKSAALPAALAAAVDAWRRGFSAITRI